MQQIPLEFGQDGHERGDKFALRRAQIELQARLGDQGNALHLEFAQRVKQIDRRAAPTGQLGDQDHVDIARLGQRHDLLALGAIILWEGLNNSPPIEVADC